MQHKLKPTFGTWGTDEQDHDEPYQNIVIKSGARRIAVVWIDDAPAHDYNSEQRQNAKLICEAGTVHHESGLSPRELLEAVRELRNGLALLDASYELVKPYGYPLSDAQKSARAALAKHKEV